MLDRTIATGLFVGYVPWASGTFGSILALGIYAIPGLESPGTMLALIVLGLLIGRRAAFRVAGSVGHRLSSSASFARSIFRRANQEADPSIVVIDEMVGMWIAVFALPKTMLVLAVALVLFRAFDIVKPFPVGRLEKLANGWGIMLDDVMAALYTNTLCQIGLLLL
jgi:phosphatidylglycerophosphatase A